MFLRLSPNNMNPIDTVSQLYAGGDLASQLYAVSVQIDPDGPSGFAGLILDDMAVGLTPLNNPSISVSLGINANGRFRIFVDGTEVFNDVAVGGPFFEITFLIDERGPTTLAEFFVDGMSVLQGAPIPSFNSPANRIVSLQGTRGNQPGERNHFFDNLKIEVAPVPEPASIAIWSLLGLTGLAYGYRHARKQRAGF